MIYVLLAVICSVTVAVLLKLARARAINTQQLIVWNYPVAIGCTLLFLKPQLGGISLESLPLAQYIPLALLMPTLFIIIALSLQHAGLVKTEVAQRLSLFIPLLAAYFIFGEHFAWTRILGIVLGLLSIVCCISWHKQGQGQQASAGQIRYPLLVFVGMGIIDILFKQVAQHPSIAYASSMFFIFVGAFIVALIYLLYLIGIQKQALSLQAVGWGIAVGAFNFANILCYMQAHRALSENPSVVFSAMNIGVIVLGAAIGYFFFKEKLTILNKIGLALAVVAVLLIAFL